MKIPNKINNITTLRNWVEKKNPKVIEIRKNSGLRRIVELSLCMEAFGRWKHFRDIPIKYLRK